MDKKKKSMIYPTIFMIILTAILTFMLAFLNNMTKPLVEANQELALKTKILNVFNIENNGTLEDVSNKFDTNVKETGQTYNDEPIYVYDVNGQPQAYAVSVKGAGLWGPIEAYLGLSPDFSKTTGIDFITQAETPGLGGRIDEAFYKNQYRDKDAQNLRTEIDAISGATGTSNAVINLVTEDLNKFLESGGTN